MEGRGGGREGGREGGRGGKGESVEERTQCHNYHIL